MDSLAAAGTVWERVTTPCPRTTQAIASVMTGLYPQRHGVRVLWGALTDNQMTLAEILRDQGYVCGAVVTNHMLDPRYGLAQGFDHYDIAGPDRTAERTTEAAMAWLDSATQAGRPFFLWVHYFDPHMPYTPPRENLIDISGRLHVEPDFAAGFGRLDGVQLVLPFGLDLGRLYFANPLPARANGQIRALYRGEILGVDRQIGLLLKHLRDRRLARRTIGVLTADHGEALGEHGLWCDHGNLLHDPEVRVPLVMSGPGIRRGHRVNTPASLIDLLPTVLDVLRISEQTPRSIDGRSLFATGRRLLFMESGICFEPEYFPLRKDNTTRGKFRAVTDGRFKMTWYPDTAGPGTTTLHDLLADPAETVDISSRHPSLAESLWRSLDSWLDTEPHWPPHHPGDPGPSESKESDEKRLKSLGYIQ